jgi:hypothetical protein
MAKDRFAALRKGTLEDSVSRVLFDALANGRKMASEDLLDRLPSEVRSIGHLESHLRALTRAELIEREDGKVRRTVEAEEVDF